VGCVSVSFDVLDCVVAVDYWLFFGFEVVEDAGWEEVFSSSRAWKEVVRVV